VRETTIWWEGTYFSSLVFKVPRKCPLVLLIKICLREDKALGSEGSKVLGSGFYYKHRKEDEQGPYCGRSEF
jgi:hypothetical protein